MSESKKSPRPKGPRAAGKGPQSGWSTSKPSGKAGAKGGDERRSGPSKGPGKGPGKGPAKSPGKGPAKSRSGGPRREGDDRAPGGWGKGPGGGKGPRTPRQGGAPAPRDAYRDAPKEKEKKTPRVDDFDFDLDHSFDPDAPPAAFPKPARPAKSAGDSAGQGSPRPPRAGSGNADRSGRPDRSSASERFGKSGKPGASAKPDRFEKPGRPGKFERPARPEHPAAARAVESAEPAGQTDREDGKSVTAGRNPVRELLESAPKRIDGIFVRKGQRDAKVQEIVTLSDENRIKVQFVDDVFLRRLYPGTHQGVVAVTAAVEYADLDALIASVAAAPLPVLLALDKIQDPGNMGAIARTAWALGAAGIIVPRHGGAYIGAGAMRASAGALHHLPVARVTNMSQALDACAEAGLSILCAESEGEDLNRAVIHLPAVLVMGGEEKGVRFGVGKHCQQRLAIPLKRTFDSLNVAQAAAICLARLGQL